MQPRGAPQAFLPLAQQRERISRAGFPLPPIHPFICLPHFFLLSTSAAYERFIFTFIFTFPPYSPPIEIRLSQLQLLIILILLPVSQP